MQENPRERFFNAVVQFWEYYIPILFVVGTIANLLCIFVSLRTEMKNMVSRYYFIAMTICNQACLVCLAILWIIVQVDLFIVVMNRCTLNLYLPVGFQFLSMYFALAFMIERYKALRFPSQRQNINNTKITTLAITITGIMLPAIKFFIRGKYCLPRGFDKYANLYVFIHITEIIFIHVAPCIIMIVLSLRISAMTRGSASMGSPLTNGTNGTHQVPSDQQNSNTISVKEMRITKMLLMVAITFGCVNLIPKLIEILFDIEENWGDGLGSAIITQFSYFLSCTIVAMNLFTCCIVNQEFRQATFDTILCRRQPYSTAPQTVLYSRVNPESSVNPLVTSGTGI